jgi:peptidoglycan hydrolase CwlO-like protein
MLKVNECLERQKDIKHKLAAVKAEVEKLANKPQTEETLSSIKNFENAIEQFENKLALIPHAIAHRRALEGNNINDQQRELLLDLIMIEPADLFATTYIL